MSILGIKSLKEWDRNGVSSLREAIVEVDKSGRGVSRVNPGTPCRGGTFLSVRMLLKPLSSLRAAREIGRRQVSRTP